MEERNNYLNQCGSLGTTLHTLGWAPPPLTNKEEIRLALQLCNYYLFTCRYSNFGSSRINPGDGFLCIFTVAFSYF